MWKCYTSLPLSEERRMQEKSRGAERAGACRTSASAEERKENPSTYWKVTYSPSRNCFTPSNQLLMQNSSHYAVCISRNITVPCGRNTVLLCRPAGLWSNQRIRWAEVTWEIHPMSQSSVRIHLAEEVYWEQPWARMSALFWSQTRCALQRKGDEEGRRRRRDEGREWRAAVLSWSHTPSCVFRQRYPAEGGEDVTVGGW